MNTRKTLGILSMAHGAIHMTMGLVSVSLPYITKELGATYTQVGTMQAVQSGMASASSAIGGIATDLIGRRRELLILSMSWTTAFVFLGGFAPSFLLFALFLITRDALGGFLWHPPAMATISDLYPQRKAFGFSVHEAAGNIGNSLGPLAGLLLVYVTWRTLFHGYLIPGLATILLLCLFLPPLGALEAKGKGLFSKANLKQGIAKNPNFLIVTFISAMRGAGEQSMQTFFPLYLAHTLKWNSSLLSLNLFAMTLSATFLGPYLGNLSDRLNRRMMIALLMLLGSIFVFSITLLTSPYMIIILSMLIGVTIFGIRSLIVALATDYTPPGFAGSTIGFIFTFDRIFAAAIPFLSGYIADAFGLGYSIYLLSLCTFLGCFAVGFLSPLPLYIRDRS